MVAQRAGRQCSAVQAVTENRSKEISEQISGGQAAVREAPEVAEGAYER